MLYSGYDEIDGTVKSSFDARAEIEMDISLNKSGAVKYKAFGRSKAGARRQLGKSEMRWEQLQQAPGKTNASKNNELILGPVRARLLFFPRKAETIRGSKFTLLDLRELLDRHGGIRIYRDNIRVRPYGASHLAEGDWLELGGRKVAEPAGPARQTFRISPNQLVGTVLVGRDSNPELADSSGREGLVHNEAFEQLRRFVLGGVVVPSIYSSASPWVGSQPCGTKYPGFCADSKGV